MRSAINSAVYPAIAFLGAFRLDWPQAWAHAAVFLVLSVLGMAIVQFTNPSVLEARERNTSDQRQPFDRAFDRIYLPMVLIYPLVGGLDGGRFHWLPLPSSWAFFGAALFLVGSVLTTWTLIVNRHAERIHRVQDDRNHTVITTGPYRFVRHPMYLGSLIGFPITALMLGSGAALVPMAVLVFAFIWRTAKEDEALHADLPGYAEFAAKTRYRLVPFIW